MRKTLRSAVTAIATMALIAALGSATPARADFKLELGLNGVSYTQVASTNLFGPRVINFNSGGIAWDGSGIQISGSLFSDSDNPGTSNYAAITGNASTITNMLDSTKDIWIRISDVGFTQPVTPPTITLTSTFTLTVFNVPGANNNPNSATFQSYVDPNNNPVPNGSSLTWGLQSLGTAVHTPGTYSDVQTLLIPSLNSPYSITQVIHLRLGKRASVAIRTSFTELSKPVPEPSSMAVGLLGMLGLVGYGMRRRKTQ